MKRVYTEEQKAQKKIYKAKWCLENKERKKEMDAQWYQKNKEYQKGQQREWNKNNPNYKKEWHKENPNYIPPCKIENPNYDKEVKKRFQEANPDYYKERNKEWNEANPGYSKAMSHKYDLGYWVVYVIRNFNGLKNDYAGQSQNIYMRMASHKSLGKLNTETHEILEKFDCKYEALGFELTMHLNGYHGNNY